jgi:hypothetical protein
MIFTRADFVSVHESVDRMFATNALSCFVVLLGGMEVDVYGTG